MQRSSGRRSVLFYYGLAVVALVIYAYGFFPLDDLLKSDTTFKKNNYVERAEQNVESKQRHVGKLVFFLIDALRYDFVASDNEIFMPFLVSSIQDNKACLLATRVQAPTVTLPRIKAITSGTIPSFFDLVLNLRSSGFPHDSFVTQAYNNGLRSVFYGDTVWLKLFPYHFVRHQTVECFFVTDYTEIDNNITANVYNELKKNDWDIMIVHYPGLDHIGHLEGPKSSLVPPKLKEMDEIIEEIAKYLDRFEEEEDVRTMLVVTGDHGMKDSGGHGGVTHSEITVPLVSVGRPCYHLPGWPENHIINQIDLAPTVSVLLGLPMPADSVGKLIPQLLHGIPQEKILEELENNRRMLANDENPISTSHNYSWLAREYFIELNKLSTDASRSKNEFKLPFLYVGCLGFWISSLFFLRELIYSLKPKTISHWVLAVGTLLHTVSYESSSFIEEEHQTWYFFWISFSVVVVWESIDFNLQKKSKYIRPAGEWIVICVAHRILRKLNQTGDKWASLPDIQGYLTGSDKRIFLLIWFLLGIILLFYCCCSEKISIPQTLVYGAALLTIFSYRLAVNNIHVDFFPYPTSRGCTEVKLFWILFSIFTVQTIYNKTPIYLNWSLVSGLLLRPHNLILAPIEILTSRSIHKFFHKPQDVLWNCIAHVWLGYVFYFYQGNGNSMANVDVMAGMVGVEEYVPIYAFFTTAAHTSAAVVLSFSLSPKPNLIYAALRVFPLTFFCTFLILQLHHLFIWTVFSPKFLYECNSTIIMFICISTNVLFNKKQG